MRPPKFRVTKSRTGWQVSVPPSLSASGKRERPQFKTKDSAKKFASKLKENYRQHGASDPVGRPALVEMATEAERLLQPYGVTLLEAVKGFITVENERRASEIIDVALAAYLAAKDALTDKHVRRLERMNAVLCEEFAGRTICSITATEVEDCIGPRSEGPAGFNSTLSVIKTFWRWCAKRGWCRKDVLDPIERRDHVSEEIGTISPARVRALLAAAEKHYPEAVPALAIATFTGMRLEELARLPAKDVTDEGITLIAAYTKTKRRRFIEMPDALEAWLKAYPVAETVIPANWPRKWKAVRRLAGWNVWSDLVDNEKHKLPEDAPRWPQRALRHTHASATVALGEKSIDALMFEFGHAGNVQTLRRHYVGKYPKKDAIAFWKIGPKGKTLGGIKAA